ncbi:MAG TPA: hypothetical protein PLU22_25320 [Polyangiaceae bacterium]|nr:hypothetical protein [Polyangiaceae bacterium]
MPPRRPAAAPPPVARCRFAAAVIGAAALAAAGCGCGKEHGDPVLWLDGTTVGNQYESSPLAGPWLYFPGGRRYRLVHALGRVPTEVTAYLSFEQDDPANFTTSAGNSALFEQVTDEYVDVHNDGCPDFFVRVVASVPAEE